MAVINRGRVVANGPPAELGGRQEAPAQVSWLGPDGWHHDQDRTSRRRWSTARGGIRGGEVPRADRDPSQPRKTFTCN